MRSSIIHEDLGEVHLLLYTERPVKVDRVSLWMLPWGPFLGRVPLGGGALEDQGCAVGTQSVSCLGKTWVPLAELKEVSVKEEVWTSLLRLL